MAKRTSATELRIDRMPSAELDHRVMKIWKHLRMSPPQSIFDATYRLTRVFTRSGQQGGGPFYWRLEQCDEGWIAALRHRDREDLGAESVGASLSEAVSRTALKVHRRLLRAGKRKPINSVLLDFEYTQE